VLLLLLLLLVLLACRVQLAAQLNWPPEDGLVRLEEFKEPWQRALCRCGCISSFIIFTIVMLLPKS
jgi:hypothetical protein